MGKGTAMLTALPLIILAVVEGNPRSLLGPNKNKVDSSQETDDEPMKMFLKNEEDEVLKDDFDIGSNNGNNDYIGTSDELIEQDSTYGNNDHIGNSDYNDFDLDEEDEEDGPDDLKEQNKPDIQVLQDLSGERNS